MELGDIFHSINQTSRQISKSFNDQFGLSGLHIAQWAVIRYLHRNGPSTQVQISSYLNVEAPTMTRTLTRLEKMGLIYKEIGRDKREKQIHLTELSNERIPYWETRLEEFRKPTYDGLTEEEINSTIKTLEKIGIILRNQTS
ncbi:MAG: MarR family winged helix-turn-helix transcriptional regulator [Bacillus sp. (in: firmicutes)]